MIADPGIERRVDRLENEVVAIYDLIRDETKEIRATLSAHTRTLNEHGEALVEIRGTLSEHSRTLTEHTRILNEHGQALAEILRRLPEPR